jgi:Rod binding domain-containing protein
MAELPAVGIARQLSAAPPTATALAAKHGSKLDKAAEEFEAVFLSQMLSHMFEGVRTDGPFGGGKAEEMFRSFMVQEYGKVMAASGGVGLADMVKREMIRAQEGR